MGIEKPLIEKFEDTPFVKSGQDIVDENFYYAVFNDKWPVCDGHLLFVPKQNNIKSLTMALEATVEYGDKLREEGKIDGYHFGMNMGGSAGQTVMWPHIHFIPRWHDDCEGFPGSVRLSHRNGRGAKYYMEHPDYKDEYIQIHNEHATIKGFKE